MIIEHPFYCHSTIFLLLLLSLIIIPFFTSTAFCSPPENPISCALPNEDCTVTNAYGAFPDRATCHAGTAVYPATEEELVSAVANATKSRRKMRAVSRYSHSIPKLVCPGGDDGLVISTSRLDRIVGIDKSLMVMTVESGVTLKTLIEEAAKVGMALPYAPYWWGLTIGGMLSTGAHGSSLWGAGSAVHERVEGIQIVTPASRHRGYAKVRWLGTGHPDLDAVKVSLGVLGVISQVTLRLDPLFKRSITYTEEDDTDLSDIAIILGQQHEFADIKWYPALRRVVYRKDDRVPLNASGNGLYDFIGFRSTSTALTTGVRMAEKVFEAAGNADVKCLEASLAKSYLGRKHYGLTNDGVKFTGYPVIGLHNRMQSSGGCLDSPEDGLATSCVWDPRFDGHTFIHQTTISIALSNVKDFILDVQRLRDLEPKALCGVELYDGIWMRYVKKSTAFLGKQEDSIDFDITYYRSDDPMTPRLHQDVLEEIEQMALFKYGGFPHWGKNRNLAFDGIINKHKKRKEFLKVKSAYDPNGLFSSEWTDQVLGIEGNTSIYKDGCALEGLCICLEDVHCAPDKGYFCCPGRVYTDARVCTTRITRICPWKLHRTLSPVVSDWEMDIGILIPVVGKSSMYLEDYFSY